MFVFYILILAAGLVYEAEARTSSEVCMKKPTADKCTDNVDTQVKLKLFTRYAFDWTRQECYKVTWADYCGDIGPGINNFDTAEVCHDECGGWAK